MLLGVRQLATRRRCPLDRVQTITSNLYFPSELYLGAALFFAEQLAVLGDKASLILEVEVNNPRLLSGLPAHPPQWPLCADQSIFNMTNGKRLVGARGSCASDFASKHPCKVAQRIHAARFCSGVGVYCANTLSKAGFALSPTNNAPLSLPSRMATPATTHPITIDATGSK